MAKKKAIPPCLDVPGRLVTWKPEGCDRLFGEVIRVEPYTVKANGVHLGARRIKKKLHVEMGDGRVLVLPGDHEDMKAIGLTSV